MTISVRDVVDHVMGIEFREWRFGSDGEFGSYLFQNYESVSVSSKRVFDVTECPLDVIEGVCKPRDGIYTIATVELFGEDNTISVTVVHSVPYFAKGDDVSRLYRVKTSILISRSEPKTPDKYEREEL